MAWATLEMVETHLGVADVDGRVQTALDVALAWAATKRRDLDPADTITEVGAAVSHAVVIYAALLYRERSQPQGFATYSTLDDDQTVPSDAMMNVYRLLGTRRPVIR